jgi:orotate phosphoribosyltransferase
MQAARQTVTPAPAAADARARAFAIIREKSFRRGTFTLASGRTSDFYLDLKPTMFDPEGAGLLAGLLLERLAGMDVDAVGGLELGAVPLVTAVSLVSFQQGRPIPGFFVRKAVKDHGTRRRIEVINDLTGKAVAILEDVTTTGGSAMAAVREVQEAGGRVALVLSVVDREEGAAEFYAQQGIAFDAIFRRREFMA